MKTRVLILGAMLGAAGGALMFAADPAPPKPESRVAVVFVNPENFTDVKRDSWSGNSPELLEQIQKFMITTGERVIPTGMHLEVRVTDIDLAGDFEPWRGPQFDGVRMVRDIYPPRIKLQFTVTDAGNATVSSGQRDITDLAFQMRMAWPADDPLRYEKDILRDWFKSEFRSLNAAGK